MDGMTKMWISFVGMGLMVLAALIISFARAKTKGIIRILLTIVAFIMLAYAMICGVIAIF